jgi:hypothetical protein
MNRENARPTKPGAIGEPNASLPVSGWIGHGVGDAFCDFLLKSVDVSDPFFDDHLSAIVQRHRPDRRSASPMREGRPRESRANQTTERKP